MTSRAQQPKGRYFFIFYQKLVVYKQKHYKLNMICTFFVLMRLSYSNCKDPSARPNSAVHVYASRSICTYSDPPPAVQQQCQATRSTPESREAEVRVTSAVKGMSRGGRVPAQLRDRPRHSNYPPRLRESPGPLGEPAAAVPFSRTTSGASGLGLVRASHPGPDQSTARHAPRRVRRTTTCTRFTTSIMNERNILK